MSVRLIHGKPQTGSRISNLDAEVHVSLAVTVYVLDRELRCHHSGLTDDQIHTILALKVHDRLAGYLSKRPTLVRYFSKDRNESEKQIFLEHCQIYATCSDPSTRERKKQEVIKRLGKPSDAYTLYTKPRVAEVKEDAAEDLLKPVKTFLDEGGKIKELGRFCCDHYAADRINWPVLENIYTKGAKRSKKHAK